MENFYVYVYLDPRKKSIYNYSDLEFEYEPFYVGKGSGNRYLYHLREQKKNTHKINKISNIINDGFNPIILKIFENLSEDVAFIKEIELIEKIGRKVNHTGSLTNYLKGGIGDGFSLSNHPNRKEILLNMKKSKLNHKHSEETKEKIRKNHRTKEYREKMSIKMTGIVIVTDETKEKISKILKSKKMVRSAETRKKIGDKNRNKIHTEQSRKNMSISHIGLNIPRFKYTLISPNNDIYDFLNKKDLKLFIDKNNMSIRLIIKFFNKGKITIQRHSEKTLNTENWIIKQEKYEL